VSCNEPPHELLLYNLENGRGKELIGHNTQIQAVEFALGGDRVISCASNIVKVWESSSGICLYTLGPGSQDGFPGHKKKISAMTVNELQPCLAATSGGEGDNQLLLWNVSTGELASDLNVTYRQGQVDLLSMDALKFSNEKYLVCGSDSPGGKPAIVQIWDIDALANLTTFHAHDTFVTCLDTNATGSSVITGSGDGSINLFDVRSGGNIIRLPLSSTWEVTSVSFSSCGTFFQASCTGNCTFIWDTRMMPLKTGPKCVTQPAPLATEKSFRALHHLSHGAPMPTAENAFQVPGYVDVGDQGVNDARWFQNEAVLVTASGNGSVTIWDPSLGQPCVRQISSHSRCINTVAISPKDQFICTGGDDQKVVLYQNVRQSCPRWRLTHPLLGTRDPDPRE
jgi:WD40 repeat protein